MATDDLIVWRPEGLYCPAGDFHIDPWRPVERAVLTHAHADHARAGHRHVLASAPSEAVLRARLGAQLPLQTLAYGEAVEHRGVRISLHPAGHVLGSAQVRLQAGGRVWVASGDYLLSAHDEAQPLCTPFEPVRCDVFITESTFGLPVYRWAPQAEVAAQINAWWAANAAQGRPSLLLGYSFGKAQRLLALLDPRIGPIRVHAAVATMNAACRAGGMALPQVPELTARTDRRTLGGALLLAPPAVQDSAWARRLGDPALAFASGWMAVRGQRRRRGVERGFVLSDHADWPGLQRAIAATGAQRVIVTHGHEAELVRWLQEQGLQAERFGAVGWSEDAQDDGLALAADAAAGGASAGAVDAVDAAAAVAPADTDGPGGAGCGGAGPGSAIAATGAVAADRAAFSPIPVGGDPPSGAC